MTSSSKDHIQQLLRENTLVVDLNSTYDNLNCGICGRLMVDAHQTLCDCGYCGECITGYLETGNKFCQGSKRRCRKECLVIGKNVFPSAVLNMKILKARVHCPNKGCEETPVLTDLEDHLRVCSRQKVECPYSAVGCGDEGGSKEEVEAHLLKGSLSHSRLLVGVIGNLVLGSKTG